MTKLSVNINKIALLRNSRGRDFPSVHRFAARCLDGGAHGITLHPRPDQRHARYSDVADLQSLCAKRAVELNVEGYPTPEFLATVIAARPAQCTLVPDAPGQLTSDHSCRLRAEAPLLRRAISQLKADNIRVSLFVDHDGPELEFARDLGADWVELYTEPYAAAAPDPARRQTVLHAFRAAALRARHAGLEVNAGHDLSLENLADFLAVVPDVLEVSIGHALVAECLHLGLPTVIARYLAILKSPRKADADAHPPT